MSRQLDNAYWIWANVEPDIVGVRCLAPVKDREPLREAILLTCDMNQSPPLALVEDMNGQKWSVQGAQMWVETDEDPHG